MNNYLYDKKTPCYMAQSIVLFEY